MAEVIAEIQLRRKGWHWQCALCDRRGIGSDRTSAADMYEQHYAIEHQEDE